MAMAHAAKGGGVPAGQLRVAVVQMCSSDDVDKNYAVVERLVQQAVQAGAGLVSLPECFEWIGTGPSASVAQAEPLTGELFTRYRQLAKKAHVWLACGGFHEQISDDPTAKIANSHTLLSPSGEVVANYRKTHLFDVDIKDGVFLESSFTEPGTEAVVVENVGGVKLGLSTCYDMRFPALYAQLREAGAELLLAPSAFMVSTGAAHWETLIRARAIENQAYFAAAAQAGQHNEKRTSYGHSIIVDPWGRVLARMDGVEEGIITADIDLELLSQTRAKMPVATHLRPELYAKPATVVQAGEV